MTQNSMPSLPTAALAEKARREKARRSLVTFAQAMRPAGERFGRHHLRIATALEQVERGEIARLIISVPPQHGKSTWASEIFPAWYLGRHPDHRIIAASYAASLAERFSRTVRNTLKSDAWGAIFGERSGLAQPVQLATDSQSKEAWNLAAPHRGGYKAAGVGGGITGNPATLLIIDDPVEGAEEATSVTTREKVWQWYLSDAYTRLHPQGAIVLIMTRWHEDDLAGRLLASARDNPDADQWTELRLPAIAEDADDPLGRAIGDPLWPEVRHSAFLQRTRASVGPRTWAAVYQQRPRPLEGALFKRDWWRRFSWATFDRRDALQIIQVWDTAFSEKQTADYSVCSTWAQMPQGLYVLDVYRDRLEFPALKRTARDLYRRWKPAAVLIEDKASGQSLIQELRRPDETATPPIPALPIIAVAVDRDKVTRAHAATPTVEAGLVSLPEDAAWADEWIEEHAAFPLGAHDDQVDTTSMAIARYGHDEGFAVAAAHGPGSPPGEPTPHEIADGLYAALAKERERVAHEAENARRLANGEDPLPEPDDEDNDSCVGGASAVPASPLLRLRFGR